MSREAAMNVATGQSAAPPVDPNANVNGNAAPAAPDLDSARFASLAKKEADLVKRQQAFKAEQEKFGAERGQVQEILKRRDQFEETRKTDPVAALRLIGFSEQEIFNFLAAQEKKELSSEEKAAEVAAKVAEERIAAAKKEQEDRQAAIQKEQDERSLTEYKTSIGGFIEAHKDKYEYCAHYGPAAVEQAYLTVLQVVKDSKGQDIPTTEEVLDQLEELYEEEDKRLMAINKRKSWSAPKEEAPKQGPERSRTVSTPPGYTGAPAAVQRTRSLSNAARPTTASLEKKVGETRDQLKARLAERIRQNGLTK